MPLQLWVQIASVGWEISELVVSLVCANETRTHGGNLYDAEERLSHYREVLNTELVGRGMTQRFTAECGKALRQY